MRAAALCLIVALAAFGATWWQPLSPPRPPSEVERLAAFRASADYARYRATSAAALPLLMPGDSTLPALRRWAGLAADDATAATMPRQTCVARVALAFHALGESRDAAALAEADLIHASPACGTLEHHLAAGVQAVVFDRQRWPRLAAQQVRYLTLAPSAIGVGDARIEVMGLHVALATLALREGRHTDVQRHADAAALIGGLPWLRRVTAVALSAEQGRLDDTRAGLRALAGDPALPADVREEAAALVVMLDAPAPPTALAGVAERLMARVAWSLTKQTAGDAWDELLRRATGGALSTLGASPN